MLGCRRLARFCYYFIQLLLGSGCAGTPSPILGAAWHCRLQLCWTHGVISSPLLLQLLGQPNRAGASSVNQRGKQKAGALYIGAWNLQHQPRMDCQTCAAVHGGSARGALAARTRQAFIPIDSRIGRTAAACAPASATAHNQGHCAVQSGSTLRASLHAVHLRQLPWPQTPQMTPTPHFFRDQ